MMKWMIVSNIKIFLLFFLICSDFNFRLFAEPELKYSSDDLVFSGSIQVSPSRHFPNKASNLYNNSLYKTAWNKPVHIKILNLKDSFGGIVPTSQGKKQKTNLKLKAKDGKTFKFKVIKNAIPPLQMPEFFRKLLQKSYLNGRYSMSLPYANLIVASLASALDILHEHPILCCLPDDKTLKSFRKDFSLKAGYLMVHLKNGKSNTAYFSEGNEVIDTFHLLSKDKDKRSNIVQSDKFLILRFLSILVSDWDRHNGQLKWIRKKNENIWYPFPLDRDMAFFSMEGSPGSFLIKSYQNIENSMFYEDVFSFNADFVNVRGLISRGFPLDQSLLSGIKKDEWDRISDKLKELLTDVVLEKAVKTIPFEVSLFIGDKIFNALKQRRDNFSVYSDKYYKYLHNDS